MAVLTVLGILLFVLGILLTLIDNLVLKEPTGAWSFIGGVFCAFGCVIVFKSFATDEPTALDVYKGNTVLEITYRDTVPVDTNVVWKYQPIKK